MNSRATSSIAFLKSLILSAVPLTSCHLLAHEHDVPIGNHYDIPVVLDPNEVVMSQPEVFDINGDGKDDVAFSKMGDDVDAPSPLEVWTSNDSGGLYLSTDSLVRGGIPSVLRGYRQILPGDFNGDGRLDLFLESHGPEWECEGEPNSCWPGGLNSLLLSDDQGQLNNVTATHVPDFSDFTHGATVLDFDSDGDLDIFVNNGGGSPLYNPAFSYLLENDGSGHFTVAADSSRPQYGDTPLAGRNGIFPEGEWVPGFSDWAVAIDANGDGHTDLDFGYSGIYVDGGERIWRTLLLLNNGNGSFDWVPGDAWSPPSWSDTGNVQHALVYDLNNDGLDDQLLHQTVDLVSKPWTQVLISNGDGTFRDETSTRNSFQEVDVFGDFQLHDLDGDGHLDLFNNINWSLVDVRVNDGEGNFRLLSEDWVEVNWNWVVLDVDNDGGTDFFETSNLGVRLHKMKLPYGPALDGTTENDRLIGGAHDNVYRGLEGNDVLDGGLGDDDLDGGPGNDELIGGKGNDSYALHAADLTGSDTILDKSGNDTIRLNDFGLDRVQLATNTESGDLLLSFDTGEQLTVLQHFKNSSYRVERLESGDCAYRISGDPSFVSGPVTDLLGDCIIFDSGFE